MARKKSAAQLDREIATVRPKRYRLRVADARGRYSESHFTATEKEAIDEAMNRLAHGAVHVLVETDLDTLHGGSKLVANLRK